MFRRWKYTKPYRRVFFGMTVLLSIFISIVAFVILIFIKTPYGNLQFLGALFVLLAGPFIFFQTVGPIVAAIKGFIDESFYDSGGNARFAGLFEELQQLYKPKAIYYGRSLFTKWMWIGPKDDRHMLTIGGSRSGKGVCCIIPNLLIWQGSTLVIDPKGTNTFVTALRRWQMGNDVHILDPFKVIDPDGDTYHFSPPDFETDGLPERVPEGMCISSWFNPLHHLDPDSYTIVEDINVISESLIISEPNEKNPHFTAAARALVSGYIAHIISSDDFPNPSLIDVYHILTRSMKELVPVHTEMAFNEKCGGLAQQAANRIRSGAGSSELQSVFATTVEQMRWLASEAMRNTLREPETDPDAYGKTERKTFRIADMKDKPTSIYLVLPPEFLDVHNRFLRLFVNLAVNEYPRGGRAKVPGLFLIDEAHSLGYMEKIARGYGLLASYNMVLWTFFQDKGQLDKLYGEEAQTFIGSSRATQIFGVRGDDAEWAASMIGTRGLGNGNDVYSSTGVMNFRDAGSVATEVGGQLGRQYILRAGEPPMLLDMYPYFKSRYLSALANFDPDYRETKDPELTWLVNAWLFLKRFLPSYKTDRGRNQSLTIGEMLGYSGVVAVLCFLTWAAVGGIIEYFEREPTDQVAIVEKQPITSSPSTGLATLPQPETESERRIKLAEELLRRQLEKDTQIDRSEPEPIDPYELAAQTVGDVCFDLKHGGCIFTKVTDYDYYLKKDGDTLSVFYGKEINTDFREAFYFKNTHYLFVNLNGGGGRFVGQKVLPPVQDYMGQMTKIAFARTKDGEIVEQRMFPLTHLDR